MPTDADIKLVLAGISQHNNASFFVEPPRMWPDLAPAQAEAESRGFIVDGRVTDSGLAFLAAA